eukprot:TRINITY_DN13902_c0_g1_i1.p1 TRINITY_DN13902_c0_g1~~TRINITY_DN13902_c0_g1_i1.p1  ORF type:complete len:299 (+),score=73.39 TRINITY_DN13902_c0_g1_i1:29-925(+)
MYAYPDHPVVTRYPAHRSLYTPVLQKEYSAFVSVPSSGSGVLAPQGDVLPAARAPQSMNRMNSLSSLSSVSSLVPRMIHLPAYKLSPCIREGRNAEVIITQAVPYLDPLSLWSVRLLNTRLRKAVTTSFSLETVGPILDHLDRHSCCPFFLSARQDDPARDIAKLTGRWRDTPPDAKDPPPSTLFIPFSGSIMAMLWNTVLPRAVFVPPLSWGTMTSAVDTRLFLSRAFKFHEHDMANLNSVQRTEVKKLWSLLDVNLAELTEGYKLHALYIEANHPDKSTRSLCQLHLLMYEQKYTS